MTYNIYKTDGTKLADIRDGLVDNTTTSLTLIGKNYTGFGEEFNTNLVKLLENFSNTSPPLHAIQGQLWYDKTQSRLKVYSITGWRPAGGNIFSSIRPTDSVQGDLWVDSNKKQLNFYDGTAWTLVGPIWNQAQGKTGFVAESLFDAQGNARSVLKLYIADDLFGIYANEAFNPVPAIEGFSTGLIKGFKTNSLNPITFSQNSLSASFLQEVNEDQNGTTINLLNHTNFMRTDQITANQYKIVVSSNDGLTIGNNSNVNFRLSESTFIIENVIAGGDLSIRTKDSSSINESIFINAFRKRVGIFTSDPQQTLDVGGTLRVRGDLIVEGNNLVVNVGTVTIEDKSIELSNVVDIPSIGGTITSSALTTTITGLTSTIGLTAQMVLTQIAGPGNFGGFTKILSVDSTTQITIQSTTANTPGEILFTAKGSTDLTADGAGLIVKGTINKTILYNNASNYKTFDITENLNLVLGKEYRIGNIPVIQLTGVNNGVLTSAITSAPGLVRIGNQLDLTAGRLKIIDNKIMSLSSNDDIELEPQGTGNIVLLGNPRITGLNDPRPGLIGINDAATRNFTENYTKSLPLSVTFIDNNLTNTITDAISLFLTDIADPIYFVEDKIAFVHVIHIDFATNSVSRSLKKFVIFNGNWSYVSDLTNNVV